MKIYKVSVHGEDNGISEYFTEEAYFDKDILKEKLIDMCEDIDCPMVASIHKVKWPHLDVEEDWHKDIDKDTSVSVSCFNLITADGED